MKQFIRKLEVKPVVDQELSVGEEKKSGVGQNLFRFGEEQESRSSIFIARLAKCGDMITELARQGAKKLLAEALECDIAGHLEKYKSVKDQQGHKQVVRNGYCQSRNILTGVGEVQVEQPRVRDKRDENEREKFTSKILPVYLRKATTLEEFIPILYLRGVSNERHANKRHVRRRDNRKYRRVREGVFIPFKEKKNPSKVNRFSKFVSFLQFPKHNY